MGFDDARVMAEYDAALDAALAELLAALPPDDLADFSEWLWQIIRSEQAVPVAPRKPSGYEWAQFGPRLWPASE